ncbi:NAD(P)H-dependent oxidoreductase [Flavobacterium sp. '19STA2R22 D10 B1']|uniref:NAD(P)H-dependent oxidoreductase n=1 Tax=Flavobacterium aerium TaxID=3037261 RepID=UPI00278C327B|nr:NAD(P)H-dependent oxidoreductase [Flavobacterium sp. '19STA2R22 D10 B1']
MKKILIINGHPNPNSLCFSLAKAYKDGAIEANAMVKEITVTTLSFNPNLAYGYQKRTTLEPDLEEAWEKILWAQHIVWIHPVWWGGVPAVLKGFIDRLFLPGRAFQYIENSYQWEKLLKGKTAHIITTLDQPGWYYYLFYGKPSVNQLKKSTLEFCGITPVKVTYIGIVKNSTQEKRSKWIAQIKKLGQQLK